MFKYWRRFDTNGVRESVPHNGSSAARSTKGGALLEPFRPLLATKFSESVTCYRVLQGQGWSRQEPSWCNRKGLVIYQSSFPDSLSLNLFANNLFRNSSFSFLKDITLVWAISHLPRKILKSTVNEDLRVWVLSARPGSRFSVNGRRLFWSLQTLM